LHAPPEQHEASAQHEAIVLADALTVNFLTAKIVADKLKTSVKATTIDLIFSFLVPHLKVRKVDWSHALLKNFRTPFKDMFKQKIN
jgi:hypothetical protein